MSSSINLNHAQVLDSPPPAPPMPPPPPTGTHIGTPKFVLKTKSMPGWFYQSSNSPRHVDYHEPRTGPYFFYGTLMDPKMLAEILELDREPILRPASMVGYASKLWGQYPALIEGETDATVGGAAYTVETVDHARKLAAYETNHYETKPCKITYTDGKQPKIDHGRVFTFAGNPSDLDDGTFDLSVWLRRVGR